MHEVKIIFSVNYVNLGGIHVSCMVEVILIVAL